MSSKIVTPSPRTWTLRFKNGTTTILVEVDPLQALADVRSELLRAIQQSHPDGTLNGHEIPKNPDEIKLAKPADPNNLSEGYVPLEADDIVDEPSGKGKAAVGALKAKPGTLKAFPQSVGLCDGALVAFKFRSEDDVEETEADDFAIVQEKWNVVVPTMEDTYGDEDDTIIAQDG